MWIFLFYLGWILRVRCFLTISIFLFYFKEDHLVWDGMIVTYLICWDIEWPHYFPVLVPFLVFLLLWNQRMLRRHLTSMLD
ncbi:hypothetical protein B0O99DRAFT_616321 [Bisporella sp. PMI_857]|nr:hypothetical protein B0O99DRAFT_616321 [Bisporella sp. PMI_857]